MLTFDPVKHEYRWHGLVVPGVTTITRPLMNLDAVPRDVLERAAAFGTAVHRACELDDHGRLDESDLDPALAPYLKAWRAFSRDFDVQWDGIEERVYHQRFRYAGTLDRRGLVRGARAMVDIKSGVTLYPAVGPQLAAYAQAHDPITGLAYHRLAVQLLPSGLYHAQSFCSPDDWPTFCSLLTLRTWCQRHSIVPNFNKD